MPRQLDGRRTCWSQGRWSGPGRAIVVADAAGHRGLIGTSLLLPGGTHDWAEYRVNFIAPASGFIDSHLVGASCGEIFPYLARSG